MVDLELEACPFCGSNDIYPSKYEVTCKCGCYIFNNSGVPWDKKEAIKLWNTYKEKLELVGEKSKFIEIVD